jgi:hypothetical protein
MSDPAAGVSTGVSAGVSTGSPTGSRAPVPTAARARGVGVAPRTAPRANAQREIEVLTPEQTHVQPGRKARRLGGSRGSGSGGGFYGDYDFGDESSDEDGGGDLPSDGAGLVEVTQHDEQLQLSAGAAFSDGIGRAWLIMLATSWAAVQLRKRGSTILMMTWRAKPARP